MVRFKREIRESVWFRRVASTLGVERVFHKKRIFRALLRAFFICCRGSPENPVPSGMISYIFFCYCKFREVLYIYRLLFRFSDRVDSRKKKADESERRRGGEVDVIR